MKKLSDEERILRRKKIVKTYDDSHRDQIRNRHINNNWYYKQFEKGCAITGLPLDAVGSKSPWTAHIDRVIPAKGYVQTNCRLVCACYNLAKKNWTDADVYKMAEALIENKNY